MKGYKPNNAAAAASLYAVNRDKLPGAPDVAAPVSPVDGFPPIDINAAPVKAAVKAKSAGLTAQGRAGVELVKAVKVVKAILTYRTCAHARACLHRFVILIFIFYFIKKCLDHLDQASVYAVFALTMCLDHN